MREKSYFRRGFGAMMGALTAMLVVFPIVYILFVYVISRFIGI